MSEGQPKLEASIGGDVADLLGNLRRLETGQQYHDSMNPDGDPFAGMYIPAQMVERFASTHPDDLDILSQRLDSFYGVTPTTDPRQVAPEYTEAKVAIEMALIDKRSE